MDIKRAWYSNTKGYSRNPPIHGGFVPRLYAGRCGVLERRTLEFIAEYYRSAISQLYFVKSEDGIGGVNTEEGLILLRSSKSMMFYVLLKDHWFYTTPTVDFTSQRYVLTKASFYDESFNILTEELRKRLRETKKGISKRLLLDIDNKSKELYHYFYSPGLQELNRYKREAPDISFKLSLNARQFLATTLHYHLHVKRSKEVKGNGLDAAIYPYLELEIGQRTRLILRHKTDQYESVLMSMYIRNTWVRINRLPSQPIILDPADLCDFMNHLELEKGHLVDLYYYDDKRVLIMPETSGVVYENGIFPRVYKIGAILTCLTPA